MLRMRTVCLAALTLTLAAGCDPDDVLEVPIGGPGGGGEVEAAACPEGTERQGPFSVSHRGPGSAAAVRVVFGGTGGFLSAPEVVSAPADATASGAAAEVNQVELRFDPPVPAGGTVSFTVCGAQPGVRVDDVRGFESVAALRASVDPWRDTAGYLADGLLLVRADEQQPVLRRLGAFPLEDGRFGIETPAGLEEIEVQAVAHVAEAADQMQLELDTPTLRVYRNAECAAFIRAFTSGCSALEGGRSENRRWLDWNHCRPGRGYCTAHRTVVGYTQRFDLLECRGAMTSTAVTDWACF